MALLCGLARRPGRTIPVRPFAMENISRKIQSVLTRLITSRWSPTPVRNMETSGPAYTTDEAIAETEKILSRGVLPAGE